MKTDIVLHRRKRRRLYAFRSTENRTKSRRDGKSNSIPLIRIGLWDIVCGSHKCRRWKSSKVLNWIQNFISRAELSQSNRNRNTNFEKPATIAIVRILGSLLPLSNISIYYCSQAFFDLPRINEPSSQLHGFAVHAICDRMWMPHILLWHFDDAAWSYNYFRFQRVMTRVRTEEDIMRDHYESCTQTIKYNARFRCEWLCAHNKNGREKQKKRK